MASLVLILMVVLLFTVLTIHLCLRNEKQMWMCAHERCACSRCEWPQDWHLS